MFTFCLNELSTELGEHHLYNMNNIFTVYIRVIVRDKQNQREHTIS